MTAALSVALLSAGAVWVAAWPGRSRRRPRHGVASPVRGGDRALIGFQAEPAASRTPDAGAGVPPSEPARPGLVHWLTGRRGLVAPVVLAALWVIGPGPVIVMALAGVGAGLVRERAVAARRRQALERALPDLIDLLRIAAAAGHPVRAGLDSVASRAPPPTRPVLDRLRQRADRGMALADALRAAGPELGELGPTLTDALVASLASGAPLAPALDRVARIARDRRRRHAEEAARRLPVSLLFPLVCCVLPAFGLLAVVPLLAASLDALELP